MQYTDIFFFNPKKSSDNNFTLEYDNSLHNLYNFGKVKRKEEYVVYIYKNMHLTIELSKNNNKICEKIETTDYIIEGNKLFVCSKTIGVPIDSFPLIDKYHTVIKRTLTIHDNNILLIEDITNGKNVSFLRVENDINTANKLINQISLG